MAVEGVDAGQDPDPVVAPPRPPTRRERTRAALLAAARAVFEADGFFDARISDIALQAGVSHGTFYTHFPSKDAIFREVVQQLEVDFHQGPADDTRFSTSDSLYDRLARGNEHFYRVYSERARMMGLVEMIAIYDDEMRDFRLRLRRPFIDRLRRSIVGWQNVGLVDADLDAGYAATALGSMVDRSIYVWLVLGEPHDPEIALRTLTQLWAKALGIATPASPTPPLSESQ